MNALIFFLQAIEPLILKDLIGNASTPISVAIVIIGFRWVFMAWREDTQKHREDTQRFFDTMKELISSLEQERRAELAELTSALDRHTASIEKLIAENRK